MSAFTVQFDNQPGQLAQLCQAMAGEGVNLVLCAVGHGGSGTVALVADDEGAARAVLDGAGVDYAERPSLTVRLENVPGAGAATFGKLSEAGVNVELVLPIRVSGAEFFAVLGVDDVAAAKAALTDQLVGI
jgi:hypothetical protein